MKPVTAIFATAIAILSTSASGAEKILASCALGKAHDRLVEVHARDPVGDTLTIYLREEPGGRLTPLFPNAGPEESRGTSVHVQCSGGKEKVLVIFGEFYGSGYPRGLVLRYNTGKFQRLEFAERSPAQFLYLGTRGMRLYVPQAYPERQQGWTVYRYDATQGQSADQEFVAKLPDAHRDQKITLR